ncbi:hypothetical protein NIES4071_15260 [Calothrix sp. NIES-4071]|nr:hypothetical protein NIES4071_15260 [Calothrix sp. NIES-4071]BAZ55863.1 hypothetical protein NIES4105_15210 [Calothrix sp. NIES-4105]
MPEHISSEDNITLAVIKNHKTRLFFVDCLKAISITAVVSYHSLFIPKSTYIDSALLIDSLFSPLRFCVPVLLTISFMLLERGLSIDSASITSIIKKRLTRLAIPTIFWFSLVAILKLVTGNSITQIAIEIFKGEIFTGAYYLLILFQLIPLYLWCRHWLTSFRNFIFIFAIQILFYVLINIVIEQKLQLFTILTTIGRAPFVYWFVYAALGGFTYKNLAKLLKISSSIPVKVKLIILIITSIALFKNYNYLNKITYGAVEPFEYIIVPCIFSTVAFIICFISIQEKQLTSFLVKVIKLLSKYSLGIFCLNGILYLFLLSLSTKLLQNAIFDFKQLLLLKLCGWCLLLITSLGLSIILDKIGLKKIVC